MAKFVKIITVFALAFSLSSATQDGAYLGLNDRTYNPDESLFYDANGNIRRVGGGHPAQSAIWIPTEQPTLPPGLDHRPWRVPLPTSTTAPNPLIPAGYTGRFGGRFGLRGRRFGKRSADLNDIAKNVKVEDIAKTRGGIIDFFANLVSLMK